MMETLEILESGRTLSTAEMSAAMMKIMEGRAEETDIAALLKILARRGETVEELTGAAKVMREKAITIKAPPGAVDCCGTGGDHSGTYNISTAVALVAAACGVPVAKHGNRAASSKSGAADVLEALGVHLEMPTQALEDALAKFNFAFLMAPRHHQAMQHVIKVRKKLGMRTIFNLLGPLANPAGTKRQLIGVFAKDWVMPMAQTLKNLGAEKAWIVHGHDGLDEITLTGPTHIAILDADGAITKQDLTPDDFGLKVIDGKDLLGGDARENAGALSALLDGAPSAYRDVVLANAAAVLMIADKVSALKDGVAMAAQAIDGGHARATLENYAAFSQGFKKHE